MSIPTIDQLIASRRYSLVDDAQSNGHIRKSIIPLHSRLIRDV